MIDRRDFLLGSVGWAALSPSPSNVLVKVDSRRVTSRIPDDFVGLGYEISSVAIPGLLDVTNGTYLQLVRTLGARGVVRVGGNTSDNASFAPSGKSVSAPQGTVVNEENLRGLASFLNATGWDLIWGLNLGGGTEQDAIDEARAVMIAVKNRLLAFEIGNEPDLFGHAHRPKGYGYPNYLEEYRRCKSAIRKKLPAAPFAGPDVAVATDWVTRFALDEGRDLKLLTHHYYRECANSGSTMDKLLEPDPKLKPELEQLRRTAVSSRVPYRICETNSFCGGGKPGVSDSFGSALWVLDFMFRLASTGAAGVNLETGVNQLGFVSSYSPIGDDRNGSYWAAPEYYGMLAFASASRGKSVLVDYDKGGLNLTAYGVARDQNRLSLTFINKDRWRDAQVQIQADRNFSQATVSRLTGPSLESKSGVELGGSAVLENGMWRPSKVEALPIKQGELEVQIPRASAAMLYLEQS